MKTLLTFFAVVLASALPARGSVLPVFSAARCAERATHVVLVERLEGRAGKTECRVLETWKGDVEEGDLLSIPGVAALDGPPRAKMVLFLERRAETSPDKPQWNAAGDELRTSVAWIAEEGVVAVTQPVIPGPTQIGPIAGRQTLGDFKRCVIRCLRSDELLKAAAETEDVAERIAICDKIVRGPFDHKRLAIEELGMCGPEAVPVLRRIIGLDEVEGSTNTCQADAIDAMAAGGRPALDELNRLLDKEMAFWKKAAPNLDPGWWDDDRTAWARRSRLTALLRALHRQDYAGTRDKMREVRDFYQAYPVLEGPDGVGKVADLCEYFLANRRR